MMRKMNKSKRCIFYAVPVCDCVDDSVKYVVEWHKRTCAMRYGA